MEVLIFINVKFCRYYDTRLNGIMKILIEGPSIIAMNRQKPFIRRGYIYIDRGVTVAYNEGAPPPEFEFAEYVVNEKFAVALPGFAVGIGNILEYLFQFDINSKNLANSLSKLSRSELEALIEVVLASLTCSGVTSVISLITNLEEKIVSSLAIAASDAWTRLRILLPLSLLGSLQELESIVKSVARSVKDSEALSRGIVSLGLFIGNEGELNKFSSEWIDTINKAGYLCLRTYRDL
jgi:cytosine/adenosine deaminase-related metal-dependent hydrolase